MAGRHDSRQASWSKQLAENSHILPCERRRVQTGSREEPYTLKCILQQGFISEAFQTVLPTRDPVFKYLTIWTLAHHASHAFRQSPHLFLSHPPKIPPKFSRIPPYPQYQVGPSFLILLPRPLRPSLSFSDPAKTGRTLSFFLSRLQKIAFPRSCADHAILLDRVLSFLFPRLCVTSFSFTRTPYLLILLILQAVPSSHGWLLERGQTRLHSYLQTSLTQDIFYVPSPYSLRQWENCFPQIFPLWII